MARTVTRIDNSNTTSQERTIGPFTMKPVNSLTISLDRAGFTNASDFFFFRAEYRVTAQSPWIFWGAFSAQGGQTTDPTTFSVSALPPVGSDVQIFVKTNGVTLKQALSLVEVA